MLTESKLAQLKPWIEQQLGPITEADLDVLADYVLALLKHEMPINQLREMCIDQLRDFLQEHTEPFVNALMQAVESLNAEFPGQEQFRRNFRANRNQQNQRDEYIPQAWGTPQGANQMVPTANQGMPQPTNQGYIRPTALPAGAGAGPNMSGFIQPSSRGFIAPYGRRGGGGKFRGGGHRSSRNAMSSISAMGPGPDFAQNTKLVVEKIPPEHFNKEDIQTYFSQFGTLANVTLNPAVQLAELEYETHDQANNAWKSPAPIFDNRFIKVYWRKLGAGGGTTNIGGHAAAGDTATAGAPLDLESIKRIQEEKQKIFEEKEAKRKKAEQDLKNLIDLKSNLLQEQEKLLAVMASKNPSSTTTSTASSTTDALKKQLEALKKEADSLGIHYASSPYKSFAPRTATTASPSSSYYPYSKKASLTQYSLDLRPTSVEVVPITSLETQQALTTHLVSIGAEYKDVRSADSASVIVDFKDRKAAEKFFFGSAVVPDVGEVKKKWIRNDQGPQPETTDGLRSDTADAMDTA